MGEIEKKLGDPVETVVEEYKKLIKHEIELYNMALNKAENELANYKSRILPSGNVEGSQNEFLCARPDYNRYLETLKQYHERRKIIREQETQRAKMKLLYGERILNLDINEVHRLCF